jgi:arsenate reductase (glutaredoxin)
MKVYEYQNCSTCRKALKFLEARGVCFEKLPIVDQPPSKNELIRMLAYYGGELKKLFNTSGAAYRELGMSEKLKTMTETQAIELLSKNGKLVKRPFLLTQKGGLVGFQEAAWKKLLSK